MKALKELITTPWLAVGWGILLAGIHIPLFMVGDVLGTQLASLYEETGPIFSILLTLLFLCGWALVINRILFWILYAGFGRRFDTTASEGVRFFSALEELAEGGAVPSSTISEDQEARLKQIVYDHLLDGQSLTSGRSALTTLAVLAPTLGFMGTLSGLILSFRTFGGGDVTELLQGLGVAMGSSLLGAGIYAIFTLFLLLDAAVVEPIERRIDTIMATAKARFFIPTPHPEGGYTP